MVMRKSTNFSHSHRSGLILGYVGSGVILFIGLFVIGLYIWEAYITGPPVPCPLLGILYFIGFPAILVGGIALVIVLSARKRPLIFGILMFFIGLSVAVLLIIIEEMMLLHVKLLFGVLISLPFLSGGLLCIKTGWTRNT